MSLPLVLIAWVNVGVMPSYAQSLSFPLGSKGRPYQTGLTLVKGLEALLQLGADASAWAATTPNRLSKIRTRMVNGTLKVHSSL